MTVYTAYDHLPLRQKATPFLVLNLSKWETDAPLKRETQCMIPFSAQATITLLLPKESGVQDLYDAFTELVLPVLMTDCKVQKVAFSAPQTEPLLQKQSLTASCTVYGWLQPAAPTTETEAS
jgi:hypothetical protein